MSQDSETSSELVESAVEAAEANEDWWISEWTKFPTVTLDSGGNWHYWDIPDDSGVYSDDWKRGEAIARDTVAQMQKFPDGSTVLRRIVHEMDQDSSIGQGFLTRIEDMLTNPDLYLDSLEPGSVRKKIREEAAAAQKTSG